MISYVTLGSRDMTRAATFYDAVLAPLGQRRAYTGEQYIGWGPDGRDDAPASLWLCRPFDGTAPGVGNGTMVALHADRFDQVHAVHAAALAQGGHDEGTPGPRPQYGPRFYAAYFRDLDGHKIAVVCRREA
jgi:catechol 2,3-dioxygenase-like lactoylglutathione lyase family enzyme